MNITEIKGGVTAAKGFECSDPVGSCHWSVF